MDIIYKQMNRKQLIEYIYNTTHTNLNYFKSISNKKLIELYKKKLKNKNQYHKQEFVI